MAQKINRSLADLAGVSGNNWPMPRAASLAFGKGKLYDELRHNCRIKEYPQGFVEILTASRPVFVEPGYERADKWASVPRKRHDRPRAAAGGEKGGEAAQPVDEVKQAENVKRAVRRAKQNLRDLALCNDMRYFVTLTLDQAVVDRYDMKEITRRLNAWCSNQVQRCGLAYVLVPERHKDGAVHFHGFVNDAVEVVDSGTLSVPWDKKPRRPRDDQERGEWLAKGGKVVYNLPAWPLGFTTAIELYGDPVAAVNYCCKYVGKEMEKIGGRWFYHGGCRNRPEVRFADVDFDAVALHEGAYAWEVPAAGAIFIKEQISL